MDLSDSRTHNYPHTERIQTLLHYTRQYGMSFSCPDKKIKDAQLICYKQLYKSNKAYFSVSGFFNANQCALFSFNLTL